MLPRTSTLVELTEMKRMVKDKGRSIEAEAPSVSVNCCKIHESDILKRSSYFLGFEAFPVKRCSIW